MINMRKPLVGALLCLLPLTLLAEPPNLIDLPPHEQVDAALDRHINVLSARTQLQIEQVNQTQTGKRRVRVHGARRGRRGLFLCNKRRFS